MCFSFFFPWLSPVWNCLSFGVVFCSCVEHLLFICPIIACYLLHKQINYLTLSMVNVFIRVFSWNVSGLNNALKRQSVFDYIASFCPALVIFFPIICDVLLDVFCTMCLYCCK